MIRIEFDCAAEVHELLNVNSEEVAELRRRNESLNDGYTRAQDELYELKKRASLVAPDDCNIETMMRWLISRGDTALVRLFLSEKRPENKISQIKLLREITGCGLKEAKEFVEATIHYI